MSTVQQSCPHCVGEQFTFDVSYIQTAFEEPGQQVHHDPIRLEGETPLQICDAMYEEYNVGRQKCRSMSVGDIIKVKLNDYSNYFLVDRAGFVEMTAEEVRIWCSVVPVVEKIRHTAERRAKYLWLAKLSRTETDRIKNVLELNDFFGDKAV